MRPPLGVADAPERPANSAPSPDRGPAGSDRLTTQCLAKPDALHLAMDHDPVTNQTGAH